MEKSQKIGIAVAGCGSIAQTRHIPEYMANPHAELIGVYDAVANRAAAVAQANGIRAYDTFEQMLRDESVNAVSICTANRFHAEMTIAALQAGKHVLCEKPMATSIEDAQKMIDASHAAHRNLMIGHNQRLNPMHIRAKSLLQAGAIGRPLFFRTAFMHKGPELWSVDRGRNTWFFNRESAFLGAMCDLGIHKIDLMRWLLNDEFSSVSAMFATQDKCDASGNRIPVEDNAACTLRMHSGILGTLVASWTCYAGEETQRRSTAPMASCASAMIRPTRSSSRTKTANACAFNAAHSRQTTIKPLPAHRPVSAGDLRRTRARNLRRRRARRP